MSHSGREYLKKNIYTWVTEKNNKIHNDNKMYYEETGFIKRGKWSFPEFGRQDCLGKSEWSFGAIITPGGSVVKNLPAKQETQVQSLGGEDPQEEEMATHSRVLAWKIP